MADGRTHELYLRRLGRPLSVPVGGFLLLFFGILYFIFFYFNFFICEFLDPDADQMGLTKSEGDVLRTAQKFKIGFLGAVWVSWWFIYSYIIGVGSRIPDYRKKNGIKKTILFALSPIRWLFRGHRSIGSHGIIIGTTGRMIWFNIPIFVLLYLFSSSYWGSSDIFYLSYQLYVDYWLIPYLVSQFVAWTLGDAVHVLLDSDLAKGVLYGIDKYGDKRSRRIVGIQRLLRIEEEQIK